MFKRENLSNPHCVYWDLELMEWSQTGCYLVLANDTHGICTCNHLTNFAILMDIHGLQVSLLLIQPAKVIIPTFNHSWILSMNWHL